MFLLQTTNTMAYQTSSFPVTLNNFQGYSPTACLFNFKYTCCAAAVKVSTVTECHGSSTTVKPLVLWY